MRISMNVIKNECGVFHVRKKVPKKLEAATATVMGSRRRQPVHSSAAEISKFVMAVTAAEAACAYTFLISSSKWSMCDDHRTRHCCNEP